MPGQRIEIVALSIDDVPRRYDDVGLDLSQFGDDAVKKLIPHHDAEVQVRYLRDGEMTGRELGGGDVDFFHLYLSRLRKSVAQQAQGEQADDAKRQRLALRPIEIQQCRECMAEVQQQADAEKQEQISHPGIADPSDGSRSAMQAMPLQEPDEQRGKGQDDAREYQRQTQAE